MKDRTVVALQKGPRLPNGDQSEFDTDLWSVAASRGERRAVLTALAIYVLAFFLVLPWAAVSGPQIPGSVGVLTTAVATADLATAFILFSQTRGGTIVGAALTASAYLFSAVFAVGHMLSFPGAILENKPVLGTTQLASYTYLGWRLGFGFLMLLATLIGSKRYRGLQHWAWVPPVIGTIGVIALLVLTMFEPRLPALVEGGRFNTLDLSLSWTATALGFVALSIAVARWRTATLFHLWMAIALTFFCGDLALSNLAGGRFTVGWYAARLSGCLTAGTLLIFFLLRFDGQQRATRAAATVSRNQASALAEEVARRSHAEASLQSALAERKVFADILESTDAMVQVADLDFRWLAINKAAADEFERIFGVRPNVGDCMLDILEDKPEQRAAVKAVWSRALGGEVFTETGEFGDPELDRRHYEMTYNCLRDVDGRQIGAYQFVVDVTDRVREQKRLAEVEEALRQSQKMETIGQLTGGVAHDFNNLLTPIVGALDLLRRRIPEDASSHRLLDGALSSAERARTLIQRLMAFARRQHLQPQPLDLSQSIENMRDMLAHSIGPRVELRLDLKADLAPAMTDPNQFELALLNLAVNARDAMAGEGVLTIQTTLETVRKNAALGVGDYVCVSVSDTGIGMDAATLARAVEPFFTTKEVGQGTGLGLSMVHGFAAQLGGDLRLTSEFGQGTTVSLRLPVSAEASIETPARNISAAYEPPPPNAMVLLVDDENLVRSATAEMLTSIGYLVTEASSGSEALQLIRRGLAPLALITDYAMPSMTGAELAEQIRAFRPNLPVLIITGFDTSQSQTAHPLPRLLKPFRAAELARAIHDVVDLANVSRDGTSGA